MRDIPPASTRMIRASATQRSGFWAVFVAVLLTIVQIAQVVTLPEPWDKVLVAAGAISAVILNTFFGPKSYRELKPGEEKPGEEDPS